jgi:uncharacterized membrane protein
MSALKKIFVVLAMIGIMLPSSFALAESSNFGLDEAAQGTDLIALEDQSAADAIPNLIGKIVGVALSFVGAIFFLLILYAGFLWMTAFGSSEKVDKAKSILEHAAVGLVIVLAAYAISKFVFGALTTATNNDSSSNTTVSECVKNFSSVCQDISTSCRNGIGQYITGECPGGDNIQCCIP